MEQEKQEAKESKIKTFKTILVVEIGYHAFEFDNPQHAFAFYMSAVNHREKNYEGRIMDVTLYAKDVVEEHDNDEEDESEE